MVVSPIVAIVVSLGVQAHKSATIFIETFAICIFAPISERPPAR
jgi:hypothetical protein